MTPERLEELEKLAECMIIAHSECSSVPDTFGAAGSGIAELIAEVKRLRAGLDELNDGKCSAGYGNGCDGGCEGFAGRVLRGEWKPT